MGKFKEQFDEGAMRFAEIGNAIAPRVFEYTEWAIVSAAIQYVGQAQRIWYLTAIGYTLLLLVCLRVGTDIGMHLPIPQTGSRGMRLFRLIAALIMSVGGGLLVNATVRALVANGST